VVSTDITQQQQTSAATQSFSNKTLTASNNNTVEATSGPGASQLGNRNRIHNGAFTINQRTGVSSSSALTLNTITSAADRWLVACNGANASWAVNQSVTPVNQLANHLTITLAAGSSNPQFYHRIESSNSRDLAGKTVTLSGWVYQGSGSAQTLLAVLDRAGSTDTFTTHPSEIAFTISPASIPSGTWTYVTASGTLSTAATTGLQLLLSYTYTASGASPFAITDMQLEQSSTATPFERRDIGEELRRCQRYFYQFAAAATNEFVALGQAYTTSNMVSVYRLPVTMRTFPTFSSSGFANFAVTLPSAATTPLASITMNTTNKDVVSIVAVCSGAPLVAGNASALIALNTGSTFALSAELF
jgi:hypothetical protein